MLVDTGAGLSLISEKIWIDLGKPQLRGSDRKLLCYDDHCIPVLGTITTPCSFNGQSQRTVTLTVVQAQKTYGLLGRDLLSSSTFDVQAIDDAFLPALKGIKASMRLKPDAQPIFCGARKVPIAIKDAVEQEIRRLVKIGILEPCPSGGVENASPVVWVKKRDGTLRMCADYKVHVNDKIMSETFPIPSIEEAFQGLAKSSYFAKIDLKSAYWQIELDEKAKEISTINTSLGLFRVNRLQMGMKNAASIFQRAMEQILNGLKGYLCYQDDILVHAETEFSLEKRLTAIKARLQDKGSTLNLDKCIEKSRSLEFLGFNISAQGIRPGNILLQKIQSMQPPTSTKELESFLGLVNFFGRMIPNYASKVRPLNELRNSKKDFCWTSRHQGSFDTLVKELSSPPVLKPYSLEEEATLTTDASEGQIAACLSQKGHPVIFVSKTLSAAERNYSNIEREAYAIIWAVLRLRQFLLGRYFTIITDHKPLEFLFAANKEIPKVASARITRWAISLMAFDYNVKYKPGSEIPHVDALSRLRFASSNDEEMVCAVVDSFETGPIDLGEIREELTCDRVAQSIKQRIRTGNWKQTTKAEAPFARVSMALTIDNDLIYHGTRLYIPPGLRKKCFQKAHDVHQGMNATANKLRTTVWWPRMDNDVSQWIKDCAACAESRPSGHDETFTWPEADPWTRIHMDWAFIKPRGEILIIADAGSGWLEAFPCKDRSSSEVIRCLRETFCRFGIPNKLVSDNAQEFVSEELRGWLQTQGCESIFTPIYHPRSNGLAERAVQTIKTAMRAWRPQVGSFDAFLQRTLFNLRNSTSAARRKSPAETMLSRPLRMPLVSHRHTVGETIQLNISKAGLHPTTATFLMTKGRNTAWILKDDKAVLVSTSQLSSTPHPPPSQTSMTEHGSTNNPPAGAPRTLRIRTMTKKPLRYRD